MMLVSRVVSGGNLIAIAIPKGSKIATISRRKFGVATTSLRLGPCSRGRSLSRIAREKDYMPLLGGLLGLLYLAQPLVPVQYLVPIPGISLSVPVPAHVSSIDQDRYKLLCKYLRVLHCTLVL